MNTFKTPKYVNSSHYLGGKDFNRLKKLGTNIKETFEYGDPNGHGVPSYSNRMELLKMMIGYLEIHDYTITLNEKGENKWKILYNILKKIKII